MVTASEKGVASEGSQEKVDFPRDLKAETGGKKVW